ncbi:MAG: sulfotransferase [Actinomycetota bacterium]
MLGVALLIRAWERKNEAVPGVRAPGSSPGGPGISLPGLGSSTEPAPIFIVGNGRSGTTLLQNLISAHPNIYITHELGFYGFESACPKSWSTERFLRAYFETISFRWLRLDAQKILDALPEDLPRENATLAFREIMKQKAAAFGRSRYGDKSPPNINSLPRLFKEFPNARVIVCVRDPRTNATSVVEMPWGSNKDLANCLIYEGSHRKLLQYQDQLLVVRLEDLTRDVKGQMKRVLDFVGEPWDDAVLDHSANDPDPDRVHPLPWLIMSNSTVGPQSTRRAPLSNVRLKVVETLCARSMQQFGYPPSKESDMAGAAEAAVEIVKEIPETVRYVYALARLGVYLTNPDHWVWEDEGARKLFKKVNPDCWPKVYPDFEPPQVPPVFYGTPGEQNS